MGGADDLERLGGAAELVGLLDRHLQGAAIVALAFVFGTAVLIAEVLDGDNGADAGGMAMVQAMQ